MIGIRTAEGKWRIAYIGEPREDVQSNRWEYYLRFKWIDPHHPENKTTPERCQLRDAQASVEQR
jgi:hypothetical protein